MILWKREAWCVSDNYDPVNEREAGYATDSHNSVDEGVRVCSHDPVDEGVRVCY